MSLLPRVDLVSLVSLGFCGKSAEVWLCSRLRGVPGSRCWQLLSTKRCLLGSPSIEQGAHRCRPPLCDRREFLQPQKLAAWTVA